MNASNDAISKREQIARRAALELRDGFYVNLGIGLPTMVANYVPAGIEVVLQSENGMLGIGPYPLDGFEDADLVNAGKETVSELPGSAYLSSADAFAMIRGGHIDLSILGAMEVDEKGNLYITAKGVAVYSPEGKLLQTFDLSETPANCAFGDPDLQTLYITARTSLYRIRLGVKGSVQY